jgi:benzodiazapine receptor
LYVFLGLASFVVWTQGGFAEQTGPLVLYAINLVLNLAWMPIFFNQKNMGLAQIDNLATLATAVVLAKQFYRVKPVAGYLLWPYVAFLTFANALNYFHLKNNSIRTVEEDLYHSSDKKNPGEAGYVGASDETITPENRGMGGSTTGKVFGENKYPGGGTYPSGGANACLSSPCTGRGRTGRPVYVRAAATQMKTRAVAPVRASMSLRSPVVARFA